MLSIGDRDGAVALYMSRTGVPEETIARMRHVDVPRWKGLEALAHTLAYDDALLGNGTVPAERFATVTARTLVICGGLSPDPMRGMTHALAAALPGRGTAP